MGFGVSSVGGRFEVQLSMCHLARAMQTLLDPVAMSVLCLGPLLLLSCD